MQQDTTCARQDKTFMDARSDGMMQVVREFQGELAVVLIANK